MSADSSSSSNDSLLHPNLSSIISDLPFSICFISRPSSLMFSAFFMANILLLGPLCILILHLGLKRWQQQRSTSTVAKTSHTDSFTYHMVTMELIGVLGQILCCCGVFTFHINIYWLGFYIWALPWYGEFYFNMVTCVERYLAVVHPITYLRLRSERGLKIRNIIIGCVWLFTLGEVCLVTFKDISARMDLFLLITSLIIISFCSLSVLFVLIRPGPGEQGGNRERVDQSKKRAFYTIVTILGVLWLRCSWNLIYAYMFFSTANYCLSMAAGVWINLPTSLVLPLLFLHRVGILGCCKNHG